MGYLIIIGSLPAGAAAAAAVRTSVAAALEVIDVKRPQARSVTASLWTGYFFCVLHHPRRPSWSVCYNLPQLILPLIRLIAVNELKATKFASSCSASALLRRPRLDGGVSLIGYDELALIGVSFS